MVNDGEVIRVDRFDEIDVRDKIDELVDLMEIESVDAPKVVNDDDWVKVERIARDSGEDDVGVADAPEASVGRSVVSSFSLLVSAFLPSVSRAGRSSFSEDFSLLQFGPLQPLQPFAGQGNSSYRIPPGTSSSGALVNAPNAFAMRSSLVGTI